jgi:hypothetical protein
MSGYKQQLLNSLLKSRRILRFPVRYDTQSGGGTAYTTGAGNVEFSLTDTDNKPLFCCADRMLANNYF